MGLWKYLTNRPHRRKVNCRLLGGDWTENSNTGHSSCSYGSVVNVGATASGQNHTLINLRKTKPNLAIKIGKRRYVLFGGLRRFYGRITCGGTYTAHFDQYGNWLGSDCES